MKINENYSELEKKVIEQKFIDFRKELEEASIPIVSVLERYNIKSKYNKVLQNIYLRYPEYKDMSGALNFPGNEILKELEPLFLDMFIKEINELKKSIDNLPI